MTLSASTKPLQNAIGILGGSFNPVHLGHVKLAQAIQNSCGFSPLYIVPNRNPAHKPSFDVPDKDRVEMVKLAFENVPGTKLSLFEMESEGTNYAIRTIEYFTRLHPGTPVYFVLGADAFHDLPHWYAFPDVLEACSYIVVARAGWDQQPLAAKESKLSRRLSKLSAAGLLRPIDEAGAGSVTSSPFDRIFSTRSGTRVCVLDVDIPEISSTEIRLRLQLGENVEKLVPEAVSSYLKSSGLYGSA